MISYPNAGTRPVHIDGPAVGAEPARPVTVASGEARVKGTSTKLTSKESIGN